MSKAKNVRTAKTATKPTPEAKRGGRVVSFTRDEFRTTLKAAKAGPGGNNGAGIAAKMGISRVTLYNLARRYDVSLGLKRGGARSKGSAND